MGGETFDRTVVEDCSPAHYNDDLCLPSGGFKVRAVHNRLYLGITLFAVLMGIYALTYRGWAMSGDEIFVLDSAQSFARRGDFYRTYDFNAAASLAYEMTPGPDGEPWLPPVHEPLMPLLAAPLVWLAQHIPGVGIMHLTWLLNTVITALTAVSLYGIALRWGYSPWVGWTFGLMYGIATGAWFYSRLLFREPLMAFFVLWAFAFAIEIHNAWKRDSVPWRAGLLLVISFIAAALTKRVSVLLLLPLIILIIPPVNVLRRHARLLASGMLAAGVGGVALALMIRAAGAGGLYDVNSIRHLFSNIQWAFVLESVLGYQVSLGRSLWVYSPVLLLAAPGCALLIRQGEWRRVAAAGLAVVMFSAWYGFALTVDWLGGWGWGPRYLLPLLPVLMLCVLPVLRHLTTWPRRILAGGLAAAGAGIQFLGMAVPLSNYYTDLFRSGQIYDFDLIYLDRAAVEANWAWMDAIWGWRWSPIRYHLERLDWSRLDIAWYAAYPGWIAPLLALLLIGAALAWAGWLYRGRALRPVVAYGWAGLLAALVLATYGLGLSSLRHDPRIRGEWQDVADLVALLNDRVADDAALFIDRHLYTPIFMNEFKSAALVATLPYAPGESYDAQGPSVISDDPDELLGREARYALDWTAARYDELWLVASAGPFELDKIRPVERYLVEYYFPVMELSTSQRARAIRFLTVPAPQAAPRFETTFIFGESLRLAGFDLPAGDVFAPGDVLPVSLVWAASESIPFDYNVGIFLIGQGGQVVAQRDGAPQATFGAMTRWLPGLPQRDNHGLPIPRTLPPGEYQLAVVVYDWRDQARLPVSGGGEPVGDVARLAAVRILPES